MATVLSRALKLPGKKSHDPREYDPLTQADSDESEDDLVINIQQNGVQNGKNTRGSNPDQDSDGEEVSKRVQQRPVHSKQDGLSTSGGLDTELKSTSSVVAYVRTTVFLLTVVISMIMVLVCAFLIPCPFRDQQNIWTVSVGQETGVLSPLELFDVNGDGSPDILLSFLSTKNNTSKATSRHTLAVAALSGLNGSIMWNASVPEDICSIQCGQLILGPQHNTTCLLTGTSKLLRVVSATSGVTLWTMSSIHVLSGTIAAPAVILPDLDDDDINDLLVLTIGETQPDLGFLLVSGRTGKPLGVMVKYGIMGEGRLIGPQAHYTSQGAIYILFGFGNVQAVSLRDIYAQAYNRDNFPSILLKSEPDWEKRRTVNFSKLINVYSAGVEFLQTMHVLGSNCSDLLVTTKNGLSLLRGHDLEHRWDLNLSNISSLPQPGYFNNDRNLDFLLQSQSSNSKKVVVIDGTSGESLWEWEVSWHHQEAEAASVLTPEGKSVFLFWGGEVSTSNNSVPRVGVNQQWNKHLYLLHPTYPGVLLDLFNISTTIVASAVGIKELEKDAFLTLLTADQVLGSSDRLVQDLLVHQLSIRWALSHSLALPVGNANMRPQVEDVKKILTRLKFSNIPQML
ncbi:protein FAM234B [Spea bombifrons]|uniref:protein FAM234B n=1 Tax=Spea bombifrons TaxID=233779 RepID=UPI00234AF951|nr:protein FAM234B [Spea bombifrons]